MEINNWVGVEAPVSQKYLAALGLPMNVREIGDLAQINAWVNKNIRYRPDNDRDTWSTPTETLARGSGDCEDIALLKRSIICGTLHWPQRALVMVVAKDLVIREDHAVLFIETAHGWHFLDDRNDRILSVDKHFRDYVPIKAYAHDRSWIFGRRSSGNPSF